MVSSVHRHPTKECTEYIIELLELLILVVLLAVLWTGSFLLRPKPIIVRPLLSIDEHRVGVGDLLEYILGACVMGGVPSY